MNAGSTLQVSRVGAASPSRVLVVTPASPSEANWISTIAELGHEMIVEKEPAKAKERVTDVDLLVLDFKSSSDPLTLLAHLWWAQPEVPAICLMSPDATSHCESALRMGALAVLHEPVDTHELRFAIRLGLEQGQASGVQFTRELARTLSSIQALMGDALDLARLQPVLEELVRLFRAERASLLLFDDPKRDDAILQMVAHFGFPPGVAETISIRRGEGVAGRVAEEGAPQLILRSLQDYDHFSDLSSNNQITASLAVPVRATGTTGERPVLGVLNLARYTEGDVLTPRDLEVCQFIAASIAEMLTRLRQNEAQTDLQQRMAAVEKLSYAGELAAGIAHEVASPVSFVHANLKVLTEYLEELAPTLTQLKEALEASGGVVSVDKNPELVDVLEDVPGLVSESLEGAERALHIVNEMKSMVRLETANEQQRAVSLRGLVENSLRLLRPRLAGRCKIVTDLDAAAKVLGREVELSQLLVNLVVNAADACEGRHGVGGESLVSVQVRSEADRWVLSVKDNGCGIPPDQLERIFAPLFTTKPNGGTGLGLGIVKRIVDAHHGQIRLQSTVDVGTTFEILFPQITETETETTTAAQAVHAAR